jgi:thioredoxin-like negative regulator of GroEL
MIHYINDDRLERLICESITDRGIGLWAVAFLDYGSIPCDHFRPEFQSASETFSGKIAFFMIDACENPTITDALHVVAVPTLLVFKGDDEIGRYEGPYSREALVERLGKLVGKKT